MSKKSVPGDGEYGRGTKGEGLGVKTRSRLPLRTFLRRLIAR